MRWLRVASLFVCLLALGPVAAFARSRTQGTCSQGGNTVSVPGGTGASTTSWNQSFPSCTVTVYLPGTTTLSTLYSDATGTVRANPFTAASDGLWFFYSDNTANDVRLSGGGIGTPFTLGDVQGSPAGIFFADDFAGANAGAKIAACLAALPATGGTCDARGFQGAQAITTDMFSGVTKPVKLLLGAATFSISVTQSGASGMSVEGIGKYTVLSNTQTNYVGATDAGNLFFVTSGTATATSPLTANATAGGTSVAVTSAGGLAVGDTIAIVDTRFAEVNEILSIVGLTVNLRVALENSYTTARTAELRRFNYVKNVDFRNFRITGVSNSGVGIQLRDVVGGTVENVAGDSIGSRLVLLSGTTSQVVVNNVRFDARNADMGIETYIITSHNTISGCYVQGTLTNHGLVVHGFHHIITGNHSRGNAGAGFSSDTAENNLFSSNTAEGNTGNGFQFFGSATENTTESQRLVINGNISKDNGGDGFSIGTSGSSAFVRASLTGNFAYRNRGANGGFVIWTANPEFAAILTGNWSEANTGSGYRFGNVSAGHILVGNYSRSNAVGYSLNSPIRAIIAFNKSESDTTGFALGSAIATTLVGNMPVSAGTAYTGTFSDTTSYVFGNSNYSGGTVSMNWASVTLSPASVAANTCAEQTFSVAFLAAITDAVFVIKPTSQAGLGIGGSRISAANVLAINFCNVTGLAITPTALELYKVGILPGH